MRQSPDHIELQREAERLAQEVARLFTTRGLTLAVAESVTGGLISHILTNVPGSSKFFLAGLCAYNPRVKIDVLGVPKSLIERHGVVSAQVAGAMAERVRQLFQSDIGLATTGYAGPATGDELLPVGSVFVGTSTQEATLARRFDYRTDRLGTKFAATIDALRLAIDLLGE